MYVSTRRQRWPGDVLAGVCMRDLRVYVHVAHVYVCVYTCVHHAQHLLDGAVTPLTAMSSTALVTCCLDDGETLPSWGENGTFNIVSANAMGLQAGVKYRLSERNGVASGCGPRVTSAGDR